MWNTDYDKISEQMKLKAVKDAKTSAVAIAGVLDQTVGRAIIINEGYSSRPNYGVMNTIQSKRVASDASVENYELQLPNEMKSLKIEQSINITFELK